MSSLVSLPSDLIERILLEAALPHFKLPLFRENWRPGLALVKYQAGYVVHTLLDQRQQHFWRAPPYTTVELASWCWSTQTAILCTCKVGPRRSHVRTREP